MHLKLIKLTKAYKDDLIEMIDEWKLDQEQNHTNHSPWAIFKNDPRDFDHYLENLELKTASEGRVPDSVFFLLDVDRNRLLGAVNVRHYLNDSLLKSGGHVGDGIRPSERGKGYGTELVRLALIECKKLGIDRVLMTCDKANLASAKTIKKNGGVLENAFPVLVCLRIHEGVKLFFRVGELFRKLLFLLRGKRRKLRVVHKLPCL